LSYTPAMGDNQTKKRTAQRQVLSGNLLVGRAEHGG